MPRGKKADTPQGDKTQKRKYVRRACEFCNSKHIQCDKGRPCQNCVKRSRAQLCRDVITAKKRKPRVKQAETNIVNKKFRNQDNSVMVTKPNNYTVPNNNYEMISKSNNFCIPNNLSHNITYYIPNNLNPNALNNDCYNIQNNLRRNNRYNNVSMNNSNFVSLNNSNVSTRNNSNLVTRTNSNIWSHESSVNPTTRTSKECDHIMSDITAYTTSNENGCPNIIGNINMENTEEVCPNIITDDNANQRNNINMNVMNIMNILGNWDNNEPRRNEFNSINLTAINPNHIRLQSASPLYRGVNGIVTSITPVRIQYSQNNDSNEMSEQLLNQIINFDDVYFENNTHRNINIPRVVTPQPTDFEDIKEKQLNPLEIRKHIKNIADLFVKSKLIKSYNYRKSFERLQEVFTKKKNPMIKEFFIENKDSKHIKQRNNSDSKVILIQSIQQSISQFKCFAPTMDNKALRTHEMLFNKALLEYEQVLNNVGSIIIAIWRRSGEICFVNKKFLDFFKCSQEEILGQARFIFEFWDDETTCRYMSKHSDTMNFTRDDAIQLINQPLLNENNLNQSSNFSADSEYCDLIKKDGSTVRSMVSITIEKDANSIPILIIGQLLPIKN
ncbi:glucose starvation modulator protein 1 [Monosporozyma unispora]|nr:putative zinc cluster protein of unknown function [Kazachstania unispora]